MEERGSVCIVLYGKRTTCTHGFVWKRKVMYALFCMEEEKKYTWFCIKKKGNVCIVLYGRER